MDINEGKENRNTKERLKINLTCFCKLALCLTSTPSPKKKNGNVFNLLHRQSGNMVKSQNGVFLSFLLG